MLTVGQAETLRDELCLALVQRRARIRILQCYRDGDHPLPHGLTDAHGDAAKKMEGIFHRLLRESRSNWCGLVVDAVDERLAIDGFKFGGQAETADDVWTIWQANQLDADSLLAHGSALSTGQAFVTVWPGAVFPSIDVEDPCQVLVAYQPGSRKTRRAAIKEWTDNGIRYVNLYTPDQVWKWQSGTDSHVLVPRSVEMPFFENPLGVVPIIELRANPRNVSSPYGGGVAEHEMVIDIQDRINETVFGRLMATHFAAFKQKWATGIDIPVDDKGKPVDTLQASIAKVWMSEDPDAKFGEFSESDIRQYVEAAAADVQHLAAISKTPPHYLLGQMVNISGDALKAAETGLTSKVSRHKRFFGEAWEEIARLAIFANDPNDVRAADVTAQVVWKDSESRSEAERVDALVKLATLGVPVEALWERIPGVTQTEIGQWRAQKTANALLAPDNPPPVTAGA